MIKISLLMSVTTFFTQLFNKLAIPRQQQYCQIHLKNKDYVCGMCCNQLVCEECKQTHQCQSQKQTNCQFQHYSKYYAKNKENILRIIGSAKSIINQKAGVNKYKIQTSQINKKILEETIKIENWYKNEVSKEIQQVYQQLTHIYSQFEANIQNALNCFDFNKCGDRVRLFYITQNGYKKITDYSQQINNNCMRIQEKFKNNFYNKIDKKIYQILGKPKRQQFKQQQQLQIIKNTVKKLNLISNNIEVKQMLKTKFFVQSSTQFQQKISQISQHNCKQVRLQLQSLQRHPKMQYKLQSSVTNMQILVNNGLVNNELAQRVTSLQKMICSDLQLISQHEKKIRDLEFYLQIEKKKNIELSSKFVQIKRKLQNERQHNLAMQEKMKVEQLTKERKTIPLVIPEQSVKQYQNPSSKLKIGSPTTKSQRNYEFNFNQGRKSMVEGLQNMENKKIAQEQRMVIKKNKAFEEKMKRTKK